MRRIGFTIAVLASVLALATSAFAADTVTQTLVAGTRTASNTNLTLGSATYAHTGQTSSGTLTLTSDDSSGTGLGWNVTILSSAFVYSGTNSGTNIPASSFSITAAGTPAMTAGQAVDAVGGPKVPASGSTGTLDSARKTIQALATFGQGTYTQANSVSLTIPADSRAGTYTGTLTTTISAAP
ncbi:MAG: hypothetical protein LC723_07100 [Actinobacteria bacterium]|nr:hypothetical protein [Actinomycetota bacterium]